MDFSHSVSYEDRGLAITLGVIALAGVVFVGAQLRVASIEKSMLDSQLAFFADRVTKTTEAKKQVDEAWNQREEQVKKAGAMEGKYAALLTDLLTLSKVDPDARLITQKWKIQAQETVQPDAGAKSPPVEAQSVKPKPAGAGQPK